MSTVNKKGSDKLPLIANNTTVTHCIKSQRYDYIPLDFIKCNIIKCDVNHFLNNQNLTFTPVLVKDTEDVIHYYFNEFENIKIKIYDSGWIEFYGSLHKFYNNGLHNHNQYNERAYLQTMKRIKELYNITPRNMRIIQLEYGVNITPTIEVDQVLHGLIEHKKQMFETVISSSRGTYYQCTHKNYWFKCYNKSKQYRLNKNILRLEIKQKNWSEYRLKGIVTLEDFNNTNKSYFLNNLVTKWTDTLIYDVTNKEMVKWGKYSNIHFWRDILNKSDTTIKKHRDRLRILNATKGENIQVQIVDKVITNVNTLQLKRTNKKNHCLLTGVNISMQRDDSFLLSHNGLNHLLHNDINEFNQIRGRFLKSTWLTSSINKQIQEIAHNIRAKYTYRKQKYCSSQLTMFQPLGGKELQL